MVLSNVIVDVTILIVHQEVLGQQTFGSKITYF